MSFGRDLIQGTRAGRWAASGARSAGVYAGLAVAEMGRGEGQPCRGVPNTVQRGVCMNYVLFSRSCTLPRSSGVPRYFVFLIGFAAARAKSEDSKRSWTRVCVYVPP